MPKRTQLLSDIVELDQRIVEAMSYATMARNDKDFEDAVGRARNLRTERNKLKAQLDAMTDEGSPGGGSAGNT